MEYSNSFRPWISTKLLGFRPQRKPSPNVLLLWGSRFWTSGSSGSGGRGVMAVDATCARFPAVTFLLRGDSSHIKRSKFNDRKDYVHNLNPLDLFVCWHNFECVGEYAFASCNMTCCRCKSPTPCKNLTEASMFFGLSMGDLQYWLQSEIQKKHLASESKNQEFASSTFSFLELHAGMSQEISKVLGSIGYLLINGIYSGYNPLTNLLLTCWDIQVVQTIIFLRSSPGLLYGPGGKNIHFTKLVNGHGLAWEIWHFQLRISWKEHFPFPNHAKAPGGTTPSLLSKKMGRGMTIGIDLLRKDKGDPEVRWSQTMTRFRVMIWCIWHPNETVFVGNGRLRLCQSFVVLLVGERIWEAPIQLLSQLADLFHWQFW